MLSDQRSQSAGRVLQQRTRPGRSRSSAPTQYLTKQLACGTAALCEDGLTSSPRSTGKQSRSVARTKRASQLSRCTQSQAALLFLPVPPAPSLMSTSGTTWLGRSEERSGGEWACDATSRHSRRYARRAFGRSCGPQSNRSSAVWGAATTTMLIEWPISKRNSLASRPLKRRSTRIQSPTMRMGWDCDRCGCNGVQCLLTQRLQAVARLPLHLSSR